MSARPEAELLERSSELESLGSAVDSAAAGRGCAVVIEGPAGIGKSRLLEAAGRRAEASGCRVLATRCGELEQEVPWGVARRLLGPALGELEASRREALLADAAGLAAPALGIGGAGAAPVDEAAAAHGLYWLVVGLAAERPLTLAVDDAHWSDDGSLRWLASLATGAEASPLALIVTMRTGEPGAERARARALLAATGVELLEPRPLSPAAIELRLSAELGARAEWPFVAACHELTGGNPFLVEELTRELAADGVAPTTAEAPRIERLRPAAVSRHVVLRLARLSAAATGLSGAVAVLGEHADPALVASVAELEPARVETAFAELTRARVLEDEVPLRFIHPLVRAAVHDELSALERGRLHRRAATALHERGEPLEEVTGHLLRTDPAADRWTRDVLLDAAGELLARGAPGDAVRLLRRADREGAGDERAEQAALLLGRAEFAVRGVGGLAALDAARRSATSAAGRADAALEHGRALHAVGNHPEAARVYEEAIADGVGDERARVLRDELILTALQDRATFATAQAELMRGAERVAAGEPGSPALLAALAIAAAAAGSDEAVALAERALATGELIAAPNAIPLSFALAALCWRDRLERARELWDEAMAAARASGSQPWYAFAACFRSQVALRLGDVAAAEAFAADAVERAELWELVPPDPAAFLADALLERGRLEEAQAALEDSGYDERLPERQGYNTLLFTRGRLHLACGRGDDAVADLRELGRRLEGWSLLSPAAFPWRSALAEALLADDPDEAQALAAEELALARAGGPGRALGIALRGYGLVAPEDERLGLLSESVEVLRDSPAALELARSLTDLGAATRRAGQRREATPVLREALDRAHRCGATAVERRAREELVTAGARPRRAASRGRDSLTAAELRIARMAAEGLSNRQIGQALFVTLRTVETHLTHVYRKLEIDSRTELDAALADGAG